MSHFLCRHVSTTNIDELSGGDSCLYRSEESLPGAMRREEGRGDEGRSRHSSNFMTGRAISCSDLLLDINDESKVQGSIIKSLFTNFYVACNRLAKVL